MEIRINGDVADIQLEAEKTIGEILSALDAWLAGTGHRLSGLCINGEQVSAGLMEESFIREIDTVKTLDIITSSLPELLAESLCSLLQDLDTFEQTGFSEKAPFLAQWKESPEAKLLAEQCSDLFKWAILTFSGEGSNPQILRMMAEERLRELRDPAGELAKAGPVVAEISNRLEEFPLDMQTGKDARAAETIDAFTGITEKLIRGYNILKMEGYPVGEIKIDDMPVDSYMADFNSALRDLLAAYEQHDTVLAGDIAEYEIAPRLRNLHAAMINSIAGE